MTIPILTVYDNSGNKIPIPAIQGRQGDIGPQGPIGPQGEQGNGLTISGRYTSAGQLPASAEIGTAYLVGSSAPYNVYVYGYLNGSTTAEWINSGSLQGAKGDKGDTGEDGADGANGISVIDAVVNSAGNLIITLSNGNEINTGYVKGAKGDTGEQGPQGETGPQGEPGENGADGANAYIKIRDVTLYANAWSGNGPWTQTVSISGVGANTQVNCCPSAENIGDSISSGYALAVVNNNGVVTFYAIGSEPNLNINLQVALYETEANL